MPKQMWKAGNMLYPLPVVMVSCEREGERANVITVAWSGTICTNPPMVSISIRKERYSYDIIKDSGMFVINLVNDKLVRAADWCGVRSGREHDKFKEMKLTRVDGSMPGMPLIKESPVNIECVVREIKELGSHDMFIADVKNVWADEKYMDETGKFCLNSSGLITYSHGEYFGLGKKYGKFGYSVRKK
ncbi:MAG: flavin reductase family protein [Lachnospiraceae bacterium]|nr:flavin reductase family protein [Lachnospiraceae bacterium]